CAKRFFRRVQSSSAKGRPPSTSASRSETRNGVRVLQNLLCDQRTRTRPATIALCADRGETIHAGVIKRGFVQSTPPIRRASEDNHPLRLQIHAGHLRPDLGQSTSEWEQSGLAPGVYSPTQTHPYPAT